MHIGGSKIAHQIAQGVRDLVGDELSNSWLVSVKTVPPPGRILPQRDEVYCVSDKQIRAGDERCLAKVRRQPPAGPEPPTSDFGEPVQDRTESGLASSLLDVRWRASSARQSAPESRARSG